MINMCTDTTNQCFLKVFYVNQGFIYVQKYSKTAALWDIITIK